jgi:YgiT-type zinc finger domain-containing protein
MTVSDRIPSSFTRKAYGISRTTLRPVPPLDPDETLPILTRRPAETRPVLPMKCLSCQGPVQKSTAPVSIARDGYSLTWEAVPAWVCTRCGTSYFEPREVERIRGAVRALRGIAPRPLTP